METNTAAAAAEPKTGKWAEGELERAVEMYDPDNSDASVDEICKVLNRKKRSVIGKLVNADVYQAPEKPKAAKKDDGPTKGEILTAIAATGFDISGFDNANKDALKRLLAHLQG